MTPSFSGVRVQSHLSAWHIAGTGLVSAEHRVGHVRSAGIRDRMLPQFARNAGGCGNPEGCALTSTGES